VCYVRVAVLEEALQGEVGLTPARALSEFKIASTSLTLAFVLTLKDIL
jgi:hypothetical protein